MCPYHNRIKQRIKNGELTGYAYVDDYKNIGECLLLHFSTPPFTRPVRPHKYHEYVDILIEWTGNRRKINESLRTDIRIDENACRV